MTVRHLTAAFAAATLLTIGTPVSGQLPQQQAQAPQPTSAHRLRGEPHPQIRKAIRALQAAKADLQHADHDFGGHRAAALVACDNAIQQLQLALQYDKR